MKPPRTAFLPQPGRRQSGSRPAESGNLQASLLTWFHASARPLPWRENRDPYRIWISEVMLQQTQVVTVIPYFHRFLQRFPTLQDLAAADEQAVLRLWEGLGYYRRARDLLRAARRLAEHNHATIPDDPEFVRGLPGFGRYTTNAVLSQAYDRQVPILEANSQRVLCRLFAVETDPRESATQKTLWALAESLVPEQSPGNFNQAIMELGALVCTPASPDCGVCPLQRHCAAHRQNRQHELPIRAKKAALVAVEEVAIVVRKRDRVLLVQRPDGGRWERMWEFPHDALGESETHASAARRLLATLALEGDVHEPFATIRHGVTRFRITMACVLVRHRRGRVRKASYPEAQWVRLDDLHHYPLSAPQRRVARLLPSS